MAETSKAGPSMTGQQGTGHSGTGQRGTAFRERVRGWLAEHAPGGDDHVPEASESAPTEQQLAAAKRFQAALFDAGLAGLTWPAEYGGQGLTAAELQIFQEEAAAYDLPTGVFLISMGMCGPTLVDLGTHEQKARYLPPLLRGEEIWCQLFSEPGAGSDVASLQTRAVRDGSGDWVVTGQKVWTSGAQYADFGALLARTNPDEAKHRGLTMFVVDMHAPGVTVRPLRDMTGSAPFNEVYFDDVRIPADAVIGEVDAGWAAAVTMLGHERVSIGGSVRRRYDPMTFDSLRDEARARGVAGDPVVRGELAELYAAERKLALLNARLRQQSDAGLAPGARGSVAKLAGAQVLWQAVRVAGLVVGPRAIAWEPGDPSGDALALAINATPASSIAGGTNQIQRGIIGDRVLGLPKEPQVDRDVPFRELRVGTQAR
ncbi:alkylation response protein AidB-like acyl-CoA dehydrogenase [Prauserella sediminis]|uniref:Alkylation response protein AidB-like acyl-CoA dehydrogenase n=1 Tax=Prauserella sediminis TaxID=577680 RepID=A0A839XPG7_9PSEU|nr:acyl-CoA dehydrogenase family protein [Prauserella sediminis]MBB3665120.1 alkylation response protein AidB-like acyl-CoA dehydrogenase [Prauserella sediminis]